MIGRRGHKWGIGWIAAFAAAYALVFQIVLTSALMASVSPVGADAMTPLCLPSAPSGVHSDDGGDPSKSMVHCPLCLSRTDVAVLPPVMTAVIDRVAIELHFRAVLRSSLQGLHFALPFQPRAPPALA
ncbi:DUF2946 family protein [Xanthobacter autotrophicus]|uniref:DUF2946 family protein n=1 Tax=Xanthobacter autotrophicus TaxID=280 RepID=UPI0024A62BC4|nr:DUF2946 family protein [Xanthobacter autotrophicus]MDI4655280.1 DUF2946 family protein [Xanthobacter autotrophicus]